jgi:hypothetical protein
MGYEKPLKRDSLVEEIYEIYCRMNSNERLLFLEKAIKEDCERFVVLPKDARRYFKYKAEE